ncbi:D-inositol 3-phosphate glycosyltransferase [compost metagenome]
MAKVLQVLPYANLNGTERHVQLLARLGIAKGWEATVALPPGPMQDELQREGIPVLELPPLRLASFGTVMRRLREAMRQHDLAHVHAAMELALGMGWRRDVPLVFTAHCYHTAIDYAKAGLFLNPGCSATLSVSAAERTRLLKGGLDPQRHHTILNGIDLAPFQDAPPSRLRAELGLPEGTLLVGTIGRLSPMKRVDVLIRAIAQCRSSIHLVVAGDGESRNSLERLAERLGVFPRVHWLGRRNDVANVLGGLDVFATASEREGLSLAALEAMASGLPLTVSRIPEFTEVADPRWAYELPIGKPQGWAQAWEALEVDPAKRERMGQAAREGSLAFSATRVADETLALYRDLLTTGGSASAQSDASRPGTPAS